MSSTILSGCLMLLTTPQGAVPQTSQLEEVIGNVRAQPLGAGTVDDLALPEDLLRRLSDRILRRSFQENFRIVVDAQHAPVNAPDVSPAGSSDRSPFRTILDVLALAAACVLAVLGYFAWRARSRRGHRERGE